jgi:hypothetical protein
VPGPVRGLRHQEVHGRDYDDNCYSTTPSTTWPA